MLQLQGGQRDWSEWGHLQVKRDEAYKKEEQFWHQKSRIHAARIQKKKKNGIDQLVTVEGVECNTPELIENEINESYQELFTSSNPSPQAKAL